MPAFGGRRAEEVRRGRWLPGWEMQNQGDAKMGTQGVLGSAKYGLGGTEAGEIYLSISLSFIENEPQ